MADKRLTKSQFVASMAEESGLTKKQAASALDAIDAIGIQQLGGRGPGEVLIPGLLRRNIVNKSATRQHEGINPFTKQPMTYKAKAARKVVKIRALKTLNDAV
jgi:nucleoid DNA-binding protein